MLYKPKANPCWPGSSTLGSIPWSGPESESADEFISAFRVEVVGRGIDATSHKGMGG